MAATRLSPSSSVHLNHQVKMTVRISNRPVIFQVFFYKSPFASKSSHQGKKEAACIVSKPLVSCLWGCGESVKPPKCFVFSTGVVLSSVIDLREGKSPFLLVLDARDFKEVARAEIDAEVPFGLHGIYLSN